MPDVSVIIPCLNEEETIKEVVTQSKKACDEAGISHEVIVVNNDSKDRTAAEARKGGAKVVEEPRRGYGNAYKRGIKAARGRYLVMLDGDGTYDPAGIPHYHKYAEQGYEFVIGDRFVTKKARKAMPWLHAHVGTPLLSRMARRLYGSKVRDAHCGMRLITKAAAERLKLTSQGMEFATEMVIKAAKAKLKTKQIGIPYHPRKGESKLNTWRDGWRHLRFMLLFSPTSVFFLPGTALSILGAFGLALFATGPVSIGGATMRTHPMLVSSILLITGTQLLMSGYFLRVLAVNHFGEHDRAIERLQQSITLEKGIITGGLLLITSLAIAGRHLAKWLSTGYGDLNIHASIIAITTAIVGIQIVTNAFYYVSVQAMTK